jgi:hypothetical protein
MNSGLVSGLEIKLPLAAAKMLNLKNRYKKRTVKNPKPNEGKTPVNAPNAAPEAISLTLDFSFASVMNLFLIFVVMLSLFINDLQKLNIDYSNLYLIDDNEYHFNNAGILGIKCQPYKPNTDDFELLNIIEFLETLKYVD